ncbi:hypothetical protein C8R45DRAFT_935332 [Mycena sanguinolenta]|nr:hypothetical protein C8R45DRAFT_935332 [Mycena sanguinolenta]
MEKYYVIGIMLIGIISNVTQYVSGNLQWDETYWFGSRDPLATLRWLVGVQIVWLLLASLGEVISFTIIVGYLVVYRLVPEDTPPSHPSTSSHRPGSTILRFRNIILGIGMYPLVYCILNISTTVIEFCIQKQLETSQQQWLPGILALISLLLDLAIYVGRPLIYGLLTATDPVRFIVHGARCSSHPFRVVRTADLVFHLCLMRTPPPTEQVGNAITDPHSRAWLSTIIYLPPDEISINEQDKADALGSSLEAQMMQDETSATFVPDTNPEMGSASSR